MMPHQNCPFCNNGPNVFVMRQSELALAALEERYKKLEDENARLSTEVDELKLFEPRCYKALMEFRDVVRDRLERGRVSDPMTRADVWRAVDRATKVLEGGESRPAPAQDGDRATRVDCVREAVNEIRRDANRHHDQATYALADRVCEWANKRDRDTAERAKEPGRT